MSALKWASRGDERGPLLVVIHGMGEDERRSLRIAERLDPDGRFHTFAPRAPNEVPGGRSWFPTWGERTTRVTLKQLRRAVIDVCERRGDEPSGAVLVGFSEGAAAAVGLAHGAGLAIGSTAIACVCGFAPRHLGLEPVAGGSRSLLLHGRSDRLVPGDDGDHLEEALVGIGVSVTRQFFDEGHRFSGSMAAATSVWLDTILAERRGPIELTGEPR
jgi:predicted esterase